MPPTVTPARARVILKSLLETPWAVMPSSLTAFVESIRAGVIEHSAQPTATGAQHVGNVSVIPIRGAIDNHSDWLAELFGGTSIDAIRAMFRAEMADPTVKAIVFDIESPGGTALGVTEFAAEIRAARGAGKPIVAVANTVAASAAAWIGAQADEFIATPSAQVGSIGVYAVHQEASKLLADMGITTTIIRSSPQKNDANEFEPLTAEARAELQKRVDTTYALFLQDMAKGRRISVPQAEAQFGDGRVFVAKDALAAGLIDRIDTIEATIGRVHRASGGRRLNAASVLLDLEAAAIPRHETPTDSGNWDGPANEARLPSGDGAEPALRASHAWVDSQGDPNVKASYKFIHHEVSADGTVGAANTTACSTGIGVLNGGRGGTTIPDGDKAGVHAHLAGHMMDAQMEAPAMTGQAPFSQRLLAVATEAAALVDHARERARLRAKEGRPAFSTSTERSLRAIQEAIGDLLSSDEPSTTASETVEPVVANNGAAPPIPAVKLPAISREEFIARLQKVS